METGIQTYGLTIDRQSQLIEVKHVLNTENNEIP